MKLTRKPFITIIFIFLCIGSCVRQEKGEGYEVTSFSESDFKEIAIEQEYDYKLEENALNEFDGILIREGDTSMVSDYFRASDFFVKNKDYLKEYYIANEFADALDEIQNWVDRFNTFYELDVKVNITSAVRSHKHNKKIGGAKNSLHLTGKAIDFQFTKANKLLICLFHLDYLRGGELRMILEDIGVSSFIFYENHIHIALRPIPYFEDKRQRAFKEMYN